MIAAVERSGILDSRSCYFKAEKQVISPLSSIANVVSPVLAIPGTPLAERIEVQVEYRNRRHSLHYPADMTFASLKQALGKRFRLLPADFCLLNSTGTGETYLSLPISVSNDTIKIQTHTQYPQTGFPLLVRAINGETMTVTVTEETGIAQVKRMIGEEWGYYWEDLRLVFSGACLINDECVGDYNMQSGHTLHCLTPRNYRGFS